MLWAGRVVFRTTGWVLRRAVVASRMTWSVSLTGSANIAGDRSTTWSDFITWRFISESITGGTTDTRSGNYTVRCNL